MKYLALIVLACAALPAAAIKNRQENFAAPCDAVWKAAK
jgi:hypothetical protein